MHQNLLKQKRFPERNTPPVLENGRVKIYWNISITRDRPVLNKKPDMVIVNKAFKTAIFLDIAAPLAVNIEKKHSEKINKFR